MAYAIKTGSFEEFKAQTKKAWKSKYSLHELEIGQYVSVQCAKTSAKVSQHVVIAHKMLPDRRFKTVRHNGYTNVFRVS